MKTHILPQTSETFLWYNKKYDRAIVGYSRTITTSLVHKQFPLCYIIYHGFKVYIKQKCYTKL